MKDTSQEIINNTKAQVLLSIKEELKEIIKTGEEKEIYFHDLLSQAVDCNTPQDRHDCLNLIDLSNTEHFDDGMIDKSNIDRILITMAYLSIEENLFNDDLIQELQDDLNNEIIKPNKAKRILKSIEDYEKEHGLNFETKDTETQVFLNLDFDLNKNDFQEPYFKDSQVIELGNKDLKIFASNKKPNKNAVVIEHIKESLYRVYLMDKDKDADIRDYFKRKDNLSIKENNYSLNVNDYVQGIPLKEFKDKKRFIWYINQMVDNLLKKEIKEAINLNL